MGDATSTASPKHRNDIERRGRSASRGKTPACLCACTTSPRTHEHRAHSACFSAVRRVTMCSWQHASHDQGIAVASAGHPGVEGARRSGASRGFLGEALWRLPRAGTRFVAAVASASTVPTDATCASRDRSFFRVMSCARASQWLRSAVPEGAVSEKSRQRRKETPSKSARLPRVRPRRKARAEARAPRRPGGDVASVG